jgi:hypothetical protein
MAVGVVDRQPETAVGHTNSPGTIYWPFPMSGKPIRVDDRGDLLLLPSWPGSSRRSRLECSRLQLLARGFQGGLQIRNTEVDIDAARASGGADVCVSDVDARLPQLLCNPSQAAG